jgi:superfamily II helicase
MKVERLYIGWKKIFCLAGDWEEFVYIVGFEAYALLSQTIRYCPKCKGRLARIVLNNRMIFHNEEIIETCDERLVEEIHEC